MKGQLFNKIVFILFLSPLAVFAQPASPADKEIAGVWKGELFNDSTQKFLPFEIAISEDNGKLTGFSYTLHDIDGKKEMGVKKIKLTRKGDQLTIDDVELISNNYSAPPPRRVKFHSEVTLSVSDTAMLLKGIWNTNRTREYTPYNGTIQLRRSIDYTPEVLFQELVRLKLDKSLSFVNAPAKQVPDVAIVAKPPVDIKKPEPKPVVSDPDKVKEVPVAVVEKPAPVVEPEPVIQPKIAITNLAMIKNRPSAELRKASADKRTLIKPVKNRELYVSARDRIKEAYQLAYNKANAAPPPVAVTKPPVKKPEPEIVQKPAAEKPKAVPPPVAVTKPAPAPVKEPVKTAPPPVPVVAAPVVTNAATNVAERTNKNEQSVYFESDSLVLTLYDNGEVDGDTVSVLMNGQIIFARQGLSTKANSKTIYLEKGGPDSLSMIMYAENLGSIPPNTGLLIIMDGEKRYEVRFSADLKTNAAILLRRKPKI